MYPIVKWCLPAVLVLVTLSVLLLKSEKNVSEEKQIFYNTLQENFKLFFEECMEKYKDRILTIKCIASIIVETDQEAARKICLEIEEKAEAQLCFAESLRKIDLNSSLSQCDVIEEIGRKIHCRALTFRDMGKQNEALDECKNFLEVNNKDAYNQCQALVLKDKGYCNKIEDEKTRYYCLIGVE